MTREVWVNNLISGSKQFIRVFKFAIIGLNSIIYVIYKIVIAIDERYHVSRPISPNGDYPLAITVGFKSHNRGKTLDLVNLIAQNCTNL